MPPKAKFSKEEIVKAGLNIVRREGFDALTARSLAASLNCSTAPIFTVFSNIEEVQQAVLSGAKELYLEYMDEALSDKLPFKMSGINYIRFAKDEPKLFQILFMGSNDRLQPTHFFPSKEPPFLNVLNGFMNSWPVSQDKAEKIYNHMSVYAHGLAVLYAQGNIVFSMEDVDNLLTEVFHALMKEF